MHGPHDLVSLAEVEAAAALLEGVVRPTPTERSDALSHLLGRSVLVKPEHLQRTGSFKVRGAYNHIARLDRDDDLVVAASAGNHAQGVALAASLLGRRAVIFMPEATPLPKVDATRGYGAEVRLGPPLVDECILSATAWADEHGGAFVPPFDDRAVIAGQGTVVLELADEAPGVDVVLVPVGGGGLLAGVASALRARRPEVRIVGVEADGAASMRASLDAGAPVAVDRVHTIADGIAVRSPSGSTLDHARELVDDVISVSDDEMSRAQLVLLERSKQVVEPSGAAGLAALLADKVPGDGPAAVVLSGGNVDPLVLSRLIHHGLTAAGRYLRIRVVVDDRPGALVSVLKAVASRGLNVLEVIHQREGVRLDPDEVQVTLTLETRGPAHRQAMLEQLRQEGHRTEEL